MSRNGGIKITPTARKSGSKMFVAQSLPMAVPNFNQRNEDDYEEVGIELDATQALNWHFNHLINQTRSKTFACFVFHSIFFSF